MAETKTAHKLSRSVAAIAVLAACLFLTTFALVYETAFAKDNLFGTGEVKINLNDSRPIIEKHEFLFEPGMTVKKDFFIKNESSCDVYYKIYLDNVSGGLADVLTVTVKDGEEVLYTGKASGLTEKNTAAANDALKIGQRKNLTAVFEYPKNSENNTQTLDLTFTLCAKATQTKNNPDKLF